jgi:hypothetical protein
MKSSMKSPHAKKEYQEPKTLEEKRSRYACGEDFSTMDDILPFEEYAKQNNIQSNILKHCIHISPQIFQKMIKNIQQIHKLMERFRYGRVTAQPLR